jgi:hypothetical protein
MKGVYVIDFTNGWSFIICSSSYEEACTIIKTSYEYELEGSYHFYPLSKDETSVQGELRVYIMLSRLMPTTKLLSSKGCNEELAKCTYPPNFKRIQSTSDISVSSKSDTQFNISL